MKKKLAIAALVAALSMSALAGCSKKEDSDKSSTPAPKQTEQAGGEEAADTVTDCEQVVEVLCRAKAENDVKAFVDLFDYMRTLMESTVTEDDYFAGISERYKQDYGEDFTWEYEITDKTEVTDEAVITEYEETVKIFGAQADIEQAYDIKADVHMKGSKGSQDYTLELSVGKVKGKWQIVNFSDTILQ